MQKLFLVLLFIIFGIHLNAQQQVEITVVGRVTDAAGNAMTGVYVSDANSSAVCATDIRGIYHLLIKPQPTTIFFTYIGFKTIKKTINSSAIKKAENNQIVIDMQMEQQTFKLPAVDISGTPFEWVYKNPDAWVADYNFISDTTILLLMIEKNHHFLRIIDDNNKELLNYNIRLSNAHFFKDCFGNIHLLTKDSAYQVYIYDTMGIYIYPAVSRKLFNSQLYPCVYADSANLLMKRYGAFQQSISLFQYNRNSRQRHLLYSVINEKVTAIDEDIANEIMAIKRSETYNNINTSQNQSGGLSPADLDYNPLEGFQQVVDINEQKIAELEYDLYLYSKPIQMDVFSLYDSIYVIDYFNYKLKVFKDDTIEKRSMNFTKDKFDMEHSNFYIDYKHKRIFILKVTNGIAYLKELDVGDFDTKHEFRISEHIYPQKVKIRGNYVYYLYGGVISDGEKYLYREKIEK